MTYRLRFKSSLRSRRLFLIVAFLFDWTGCDYSSQYTYVIDNMDHATVADNGNIYQSSLSNAHVPEEEAEPKIQDYFGRPVWFVDEEKGQCLGPHGFGECGDVNLWKMKNISESEFSLLSPQDDELRCLGRQKKFGYDFPTVRLRNCQSWFPSFSFNVWTYDMALKGLIVSPHFRSLVETQCLLNTGLSSILVPCSLGHTPLTIVVLEIGDIHPKSIKPQEYLVDAHSSSSMPFFWIHQRTGLEIPRSLNHVLPLRNSLETHSLMGGDIFTKRVFGYDFNVYVVALYIEASSARADSSALNRYRDMPSAELAASDAFYDDLVQPAVYDRSLLIKLAMGLKKEIMVNGLVDELKVSPRNAQLLQNASRLYEPADCAKGLEMLLTWRHLEPDTGRADVLEIRMDGHLYISLHEDGLAQDFFSQFVNNDPVSALAKTAFCDGFPGAIGSDSSKHPLATPQRNEGQGRMQISPSSMSWSGKLVGFVSDYVLFGLASRLYGLGHRSVKLWRVAVRRNKEWRERVGGLLVRKRPTAEQEEKIAAIIIFLNVLVLIMISLPPRFIASPARAVVRTVRRRSSQATAVVSSVKTQINSTIKKSLSNKSLHKLISLQQQSVVGVS